MNDHELSAAIAAAVRTGRLRVDDTWVSRRHGYFYMSVPKVASSKIKMLLHRLEGYSLPADPFDVHARDQPGTPFVDKLPAFGAKEHAEILRGPGWRRFAFVRNPYARLYSAYKSKISDLASPYVGVREAIWRVAGERRPPAEAPPFDAFARYVAQLPDLERDGHWRSQTGILCLDLVDFGFLGRFETFGRDLGAVLRSLGAPEDLFAELDVVVGGSAALPAAPAYDAALAQLVYDVYRADFETFDYGQGSWRDLV